MCKSLTWNLLILLQSCVDGYSFGSCKPKGKHWHCAMLGVNLRIVNVGFIQSVPWWTPSSFARSAGQYQVPNAICMHFCAEALVSTGCGHRLLWSTMWEHIICSVSTINTSICNVFRIGSHPYSKICCKSEVEQQQWHPWTNGGIFEHDLVAFARQVENGETNSSNHMD